ncbi:hypothetical protein BTJ49_03520 [Oleiagrimonas sp. MCCC 1A03011]|nr:hypothetical protein BTJ49_03520 [Oleiagrimonas sp. MCCC 1A03011]
MPSSQDRAARAARFEAAAGQPVNHIQLNSIRGFYAWDPINDHQVVAYVTPRRVYLMDLPSCPGLEYTPAISITSHMEQVSATFDSIIPSNTGVPCQIRRIRPLDRDMIKDAQKHRGDVEVMAKPAPDMHKTTNGSGS